MANHYHKGAAPRMIPQETYWTYKTEGTPAEPPPGSPMTERDWTSLSPGMRREIWRDYQRQANAPQS